MQGWGTSKMEDVQLDFFELAPESSHVQPSALPSSDLFFVPNESPSLEENSSTLNGTTNSKENIK